MSQKSRRDLWHLLAQLAAPLFLVALVAILWEPVSLWLQGEKRYDLDALKEWVREARVYQTLPELVGSFLKAYDEYRQLAETRPQTAESGKLDGELATTWSKVILKREEIQVHLKSLGEPLVKVYPGQLPLFPVLYRLEVTFAEELQLDPIVWDSQLPRQQEQYRQEELANLDPQPGGKRAWVTGLYRTRVFAFQQYLKHQDTQRQLRLGGVILIALAALLLWFFLAQRREEERQRRERRAEQQLHEAEKRHQEAENRNLEMKSQMFASIGIMAGSYAHNIKNLLIRPNALLSRCLEVDGLSTQQSHMLREVQNTMGTVTERLQQILKTVQRDPTQSVRERIDLSALILNTQQTWQDLAAEKWRVLLRTEVTPEPLWLTGDASHLQQAIENLVFNARDAVWELRERLRDYARQFGAPEAAEDDLARAFRTLFPTVKDRRAAIIAATSWKGEVVLRTRAAPDFVILEVTDNGIGMNAEVRNRCTDTHFSTKRNNAIFGGFSAGMGLGLSFVKAILENHQARLEIESEPFRGTTFRIRLPQQQQT